MRCGGILNAGGNMMHDWQVEEAFRAGDRATGNARLDETYIPRCADKPVSRTCRNCGAIGSANKRMLAFNSRTMPNFP